MIEEVSEEQQLREELAKIDTKNIVIVDQASYDKVARTLVEVIKPWRKRWLEYWEPKKGSAYKTWKMLCDAFNDGDEPAEKVETAYKKAIEHWDMEQTRIQEERQRAAQAEAERKEQEKRDAAILAAEVEGDMEAAEEIEAAPVLAVAPPVEPAYQRATGISIRKTWKAVVVDVKALCKAIGAKKLKLAPEDEAKLAECLSSILAPRAQADKSLLSIPGVKGQEVPVVGGRSR